MKSTDLLPKDMSIPKFIEEFSLDKWGRAFINKETVERHLVSFLCPSDWICRAIDYFGKRINISEIPESEVKGKLSAAGADSVVIIQNTYNLKTREKDAISNYKNCGAIWFTLNGR